MSFIGCVDFLTVCESILPLAIGVHVLLVFIFSVGCLTTTGFFIHLQQEQIVEPNDVQQEQNEKMGIKRKQQRRQRKLVK
jgi:hypothetical protein